MLIGRNPTGFVCIGDDYFEPRDREEIFAKRFALILWNADLKEACEPVREVDQSAALPVSAMLVHGCCDLANDAGAIFATEGDEENGVVHDFEGRSGEVSWQSASIRGSV